MAKNPGSGTLLGTGRRSWCCERSTDGRAQRHSLAWCRAARYLWGSTPGARSVEEPRVTVIQQLLDYQRFDVLFWHQSTINTMILNLARGTGSSPRSMARSTANSRKAGRRRTCRLKRSDETQAVTAQLALLFNAVNTQCALISRQFYHGGCIQTVQPAQCSADRGILKADSTQGTLECSALGGGYQNPDRWRKGRRGCRSSKGLSGSGNPLIVATRQVGDLTIQFQVQQHHRNSVRRQPGAGSQVVETARVKTHT
jgi:hypothetical protein